MSNGGWYGAGTPEYAQVQFVKQVLEAASAKVDGSSEALVGGFISFMSDGWAQLSDKDFEKDMAELVNGLRLTRAHIQSQGRIKS